MPLLIAGKSDLELLRKFKEDDFSTYELHLGFFDEEEIYQRIASLPEYIKIVSIHNPTQVKISNQIKEFDLSEEGGIGKGSLKVLKKTVKLAKKIGSRIIVIHGAKYNLNQSKEEALFLLAERIKSLDAKEVSLCFETDALWHNTFYPRKALLVSVEDFDKLDRLLKGNLKITADIEHLQISFYFSKFIESIGGEKGFIEEYPFNDTNKFEIDILEFIKKYYFVLDEQFKEYLTSFFAQFKNKIQHLHINGSDPFNFIFDPRTFLPLIGEHLPLGFKDGRVEDKFDYNYLAELFNSLPKEKKIYVVIEAWRNDPEEFVSEMRRSKQFLIKYLNQQKE